MAVVLFFLAVVSHRPRMVAGAAVEMPFRDTAADHVLIPDEAGFLAPRAGRLVGHVEESNAGTAAAKRGRWDLIPVPPSL